MRLLWAVMLHRLAHRGEVRPGRGSTVLYCYLLVTHGTGTACICTNALYVQQPEVSPTSILMTCNTLLLMNLCVRKAGSIVWSRAFCGRDRWYSRVRRLPGDPP